MSLPSALSTSPHASGVPLAAPTRDRPNASIAAPAVCIWIGLQVLLLAFRPGYFFPPTDVLDSWIYASYKWDASRQFAEFGSTYYGARVPVFALGAALHALLPAVAANIVEKLAWSAALAAGVARVARVNGNRAATLIAVSVATLAPPVICALHGDYIEIPVITFGVAALACIVAARGATHPGRAWAAAGFCLACMGFSNLSTLGVQAMGIVTVHAFWHPLPWRTRLRALMAATGGAFTALALVGVLSVSLGGEFFILRAQLRALFELASLATNPWAPSDWGWLKDAFWLVLPVSALAWGWMRTTDAPRETDASTPDLIRALAAGLTTSILLALLLELRGQGVLYHHFYAALHLCLALPLLALCAFPRGTGHRMNMIISVAAFGTVALILLSGRWPAVVIAVQGAVPFSLSGPVLLAGMAAGALMWGARTTLAGPAVLGAILLAATPLGFHEAPNSDRLRERYAAVHAAFTVLNTELADGNYRIWIDDAQPDGRSLAATKLWDYRLFSPEPFPSTLRAIRADRSLVIPGPIGRAPERIAEARAILSDRNWRIAGEKIITVPAAPALGFELAIFRLSENVVDPRKSTGGAARLLQELSPEALEPRIGGWERNAYAGPPDALISRRGETTVFSPQSERDHIAGKFVDLSPEVRELTLEIELPEPGRAHLVVQSSEFATLATFPLNTAGRTLHRVHVPPGTRALRVYLAGGAATFPTRVALHEISVIH